MRLAGPNPVMLERVTAPARNFPVTDERYRQAMGDKGDSLAAAGAEGRLFQVDYGIDQSHRRVHQPDMRRNAGAKGAGGSSHPHPLGRACRAARWS